MPTLNQTLKALYQDTLSDGEVELAKDNLLGFFKLLQEIDTRLQKEANLPQNTPQNAIQRTLKDNAPKPRTKSNISNLKSNKSQNDNNRNSN